MKIRTIEDTFVRRANHLRDEVQHLKNALSVCKADTLPENLDSIRMRANAALQALVEFSDWFHKRKEKLDVPVAVVESHLNAVISLIRKEVSYMRQHAQPQIIQQHGYQDLATARETLIHALDVFVIWLAGTVTGTHAKDPALYRIKNAVLGPLTGMVKRLDTLIVRSAAGDAEMFMRMRPELNTTIQKIAGHFGVVDQELSSIRTDSPVHDGIRRIYQHRVPTIEQEFELAMNARSRHEAEHALVTAREQLQLFVTELQSMLNLVS